LVGADPIEHRLARLASIGELPEQHRAEASSQIQHQRHDARGLPGLREADEKNARPPLRRLVRDISGWRHRLRPPRITHGALELRGAREAILDPPSVLEMKLKAPLRKASTGWEQVRLALECCTESTNGNPAGIFNHIAQPLRAMLMTCAVVY